MQHQISLQWNDAPLSLSNNLGIKHHALLYSRATRKNILAGISTYELEVEKPTANNAEKVLVEIDA